MAIKILHIETSTKQCSVAISSDGNCIAKRVLLADKFSHEEKLHLFIEEVLRKSSLSTSQIDAIAISKGPGSFTGLRIGVAAAKGLCFSLDIPLIAINTLELMVQHNFKNDSYDFFIPMLDARRMEVYAAIFDKKKKIFKKTHAKVLTNKSYVDQVGDGTCLIIGNGARKFQSLIPIINARFTEKVYYPNAEKMCSLVWNKFKNNDFESLSLFEPYYLKDFQTTISKSPE